MGQLIDTSVIVNLERRKAPREELLRIGADDDWGIAAVAIAELLVGVQRAPNEQVRSIRQAHLDAVLEDVPVIPFDTVVAGS